MDITHHRNNNTITTLQPRATISYSSINEAKRASRKLAPHLRNTTHKSNIIVKQLHRPAIKFTKYGICGVSCSK